MPVSSVSVFMIAESFSLLYIFPPPFESVDLHSPPF